MSTMTSINVDHVASCPEISPPDCSDSSLPEIPDHMHHQGIRWFRTSLGVSLGLGKGWQIQTILPFDVKSLTIDYSLDGEPYSPPYGGIHHRNETLIGIADPKVWLQRYVGLPNNWVVGFNLGSSVPLGKTEENPFALAAEGKEHQHFQRGTGTFVPAARADLFWFGVRWRAMGFIRGETPLYESPKGYQPGRNVGYGVTGAFRWTPDTQLMLLSEVSHTEADTWDGDASSTPGRDLVMGGVGAVQVIRTGLVLQAQIRTTVWQQTRALMPEDQLIQRFLFTVGISCITVLSIIN